MHASIALLLELGLLLVLLSVRETIARRLSLMPIPLYLLAGLVVGDDGLVAVPTAGQYIQASARSAWCCCCSRWVWGSPVRSSRSASSGMCRSAAVDFVLNATPEAVAGLLLGLGPAGVLALAGATWVSSSGIIAQVLADLGLLRNPETGAVLGVLVLKDFAMAVYLPVLAVVAASGTWWQALVGVVVAVGALLTALYAWGHPIGGCPVPPRVRAVHAAGARHHADRGRPRWADQHLGCGRRVPGRAESHRRDHRPGP